MRFERHHAAWIVASVITVASFVGATAYTQNRLARLDALSSTIETNAVPSIEYVSRAAVRLTRLNQLIDDLSVDGRRGAAAQAARQEAAALREDVDRYIRLPPLPGEADLWAQLRSDVDRAVRLVDAAIDEAGRAPASPSASATAASQVDDALDGAVRSVLAALEFDVRQSEAMARDVRRLRMATLRMIVELDLLATAIALAAVGFAYRAARRHDRLAAEHHALLTERVAELDRFAGRVAHDVLSPLTTIAAGLSLLALSADERAQTYIDRCQRALQRVQQLVEGLLLFARSGARPDPASACDVGAVLATVVADSADTAAEAGIELVVGAVEPARVRCSVGVLTSVAQNLVRNAIKYIGPTPVRRVEVRVKAVGSMARLEVEDTGPGVPEQIRRTLFEPFVRGPNERADGAGLGLATVKRLVESHGGRVGVESTPGAGSVFWAELPAVPALSPDAAEAAQTRVTEHV